MVRVKKEFYVIFNRFSNITCNPVHETVMNNSRSTRPWGSRVYAVIRRRSQRALKSPNYNSVLYKKKKMVTSIHIISSAEAMCNINEKNYCTCMYRGSSEDIKSGFYANAVGLLYVTCMRVHVFIRYTYYDV